MPGGGANGLVLFNRFYQPDIDLDELEIRPNVLLSGPQAQVDLDWNSVWGCRPALQAAVVCISHKMRSSCSRSEPTSRCFAQPCFGTASIICALSNRESWIGW